VDFERADFGACAAFSGVAVAAVPKHAHVALENASELRGAVAVVHRGVCPFADKAQRLAAAGVAAVVFVNTHDALTVPADPARACADLEVRAPKRGTGVGGAVSLGRSPPTPPLRPHGACRSLQVPVLLVTSAAGRLLLPGTSVRQTPTAHDADAVAGARLALLCGDPRATPLLLAAFCAAHPRAWAANAAAAVTAVTAPAASAGAAAPPPAASALQLLCSNPNLTLALFRAAAAAASHPVLLLPQLAQLADARSPSGRLPLHALAANSHALRASADASGQALELVRAVAALHPDALHLEVGPTATAKLEAAPTRWYTVDSNVLSWFLLAFCLFFLPLPPRPAPPPAPLSPPRMRKSARRLVCCATAGCCRPRNSRPCSSFGRPATRPRRSEFPPPGAPAGPPPPHPTNRSPATSSAARLVPRTRARARHVQTPLRGCIPPLAV
jgi:hypothetical protein